MGMKSLLVVHASWLPYFVTHSDSAMSVDSKQARQERCSKNKRIKIAQLGVFCMKEIDKSSSLGNGFVARTCLLSGRSEQRVAMRQGIIPFRRARLCKWKFLCSHSRLLLQKVGWVIRIRVEILLIAIYYNEHATRTPFVFLPDHIHAMIWHIQSIRILNLLSQKITTRSLLTHRNRKQLCTLFFMPLFLDLVVLRNKLFPWEIVNICDTCMEWIMEDLL